MEIPIKTVPKIHALVDKFIEDAKLLGVSIETEYDNQGQKMLYTGLYMGPEDRIFTEKEEADKAYLNS